MKMYGKKCNYLLKCVKIIFYYIAEISSVFMSACTFTTIYFCVIAGFQKLVRRLPMVHIGIERSLFHMRRLKLWLEWGYYSNGIRIDRKLCRYHFQSIYTTVWSAEDHAFTELTSLSIMTRLRSVSDMFEHFLRPRVIFLMNMDKIMTSGFNEMATTARIPHRSLKTRRDTFPGHNVSLRRVAFARFDSTLCETISNSRCTDIVCKP